MQTLDLAIMRTLMAVVETGSFARAAEVVGRSESAVSLQMKRLEEQLGEPVFLRTGKHMALTDAGTTLLGYAQRLLDLNDEALTAASGAALNSSVTLAVPHDVAETWLPAVVEGFARSHPSVALRTVEGRSTAVLERLAAGEIDLAVAFSAARAEDALWSGCLPMIWIGTARFRLQTQQPGSARRLRSALCFSVRGHRNPRSGRYRLVGGLFQFQPRTPGLP